MNQISRISPVSDHDAARMVSDEALTDLAGQITATPVSGATSRRSASRPPASRGRWRVVAPVAGLAAAAAVAAAAVVVVQGNSAPGTHPSGTAQPPPAAVPTSVPASAAQLVAYATRAASVSPAFDPGPNQWIYTEFLAAASSAGGGGYLFGPPNERDTQKSWTRGDHGQIAFFKNGKLVVTTPDTPAPVGSRISPWPAPLGWPRADYAYLNSLPASPARLTALIKANLKAEPDPIGAEGVGNLGVFNAIQALMENMVLPPKLLATLYGVLARDPVVHFERSVTDLADRTGVGFYTIQEGYLKEQIVINPRTYAYMGHLDVTVKAHTSVALDQTAHFRKGQVLGAEAQLASGLVSRPGQLP